MSTIIHCHLLLLGLYIYFHIGFGHGLHLYTRCSNNIIHLWEDGCILRCYNHRNLFNLLCEQDGSTALPCLDSLTNETQICAALQCTGSNSACSENTRTNKVDRLIRVIQESESSPGQTRRGNWFYKDRNRNYHESYNAGYAYTYTYTILFVLLFVVLTSLAANRCFKYYSKMYKSGPSSQTNPQIQTLSLGVRLEVDSSRMSSLSHSLSRSSVNLADSSREQRNGDRAVSAPPSTILTIPIRPSLATLTPVVTEQNVVRLPFADVPPSYAMATQITVPPPAYEEIMPSLKMQNSQYI